MMHTYRKFMENDEEVFSVGYFNPQGTPAMPQHPMWVSLQDFKDERKARRLVNYLNGGHGRNFVEPWSPPKGASE